MPSARMKVLVLVAVQLAGNIDACNGAAGSRCNGMDTSTIWMRGRGSLVARAQARSKLRNLYPCRSIHSRRRAPSQARTLLLCIHIWLFPFRHGSSVLLLPSTRLSTPDERMDPFHPHRSLSPRCVSLCSCPQPPRFAPYLQGRVPRVAFFAISDVSKRT